MIRVRVFLILLLASATFACGLYKPPIAPELLAPKAVMDLTFAVEGEGVRFNWQSPDRDVQGEDLKTIEGYRLLRKGPADDYDSLIQKEFSVLKFVEDKHLELQKKLRDEAIEKGVLTRNAKVPEEEKKFTYHDKDLEQDKFYSYQIIPVNQGGVAGEPSDLMQMRYLGEESRFLTIKTALESGSTSLN